jgi:hypothetical protein
LVYDPPLHSFVAKRGMIQSTIFSGNGSDVLTDLCLLNIGINNGVVMRKNQCMHVNVAALYLELRS